MLLVFFLCSLFLSYFFVFFFFNDTATTEIYTLSLHDALPILSGQRRCRSHLHACSLGSKTFLSNRSSSLLRRIACFRLQRPTRSEEHTSELQSRQYLVCRLLLEKKQNI